MSLKKLLILPLVLMSVSAMGGENANIGSIDNDPDCVSKNKTQNEYAKMTVNGNSYCFECDDDHGDVPHNVFVFWSRDNNQILSKRCRLEKSGDLWEDGRLAWCSGCDNGKDRRNCNCSGEIINLTGNTKRALCLSDSHKNRKDFASGAIRFIQGDNTNNPACVVYIKSDAEKECEKDPKATWNDAKHECITDKDVTPPDDKVDPTPNPDPKPNGDCTQRATANGRACCRAGNKTIYDSKTNVCTCVFPGTKTPDTTKEWKQNGETGLCVDKTVNPVDDKKPCDCKAAITAVATATSGCAKTSAAAALAKVEVLCPEGKPIDGCKVDDLSAYVSAISVAVADCEKTPVNDEAALKRITEKVNSVEKRFGELDVSVWKTAEGNFNGARLASDSIAGVVLGTTGALITSNVVKKNQIKSGFEDIVCTVGGQTVGNYGDEITVGIK